MGIQTACRLRPLLQGTALCQNDIFCACGSEISGVLLMYFDIQTALVVVINAQPIMFLISINLPALDEAMNPNV
jgi:hypothetical protein